ncbi:non-specific lipid transfer protein GPI-anchored 5-like isoform X4 [Cannabis sativa]|uniref:non-specific lipid transfer protein GPI-anchored 5-like isoform X4 n=1 Tax=Cannabis sativa TaxID=3483 RepID=UPI0029CA128A|nr:non-specific lipid transfer protein GPI-anchored 5-like isoform X4 [Cannabis sativa]
MISKVTNMALVVLVLVTMLWARTMAQQSCTNVLISMAPCLNYVTGSSSTPSSSCCSQLASVVQKQPRCLCMALNGGGASLGVNINQTLALALPAACNVETPPVSKCGTLAPIGSPDGSPEMSGGSSSSEMKLSLNFTLLVVLIATYASSTYSSSSSF